jgi:hypothetical protein
MIARTENEFKLFNRMDVARREYESLHGVGSGGDGAAERRLWESSSTDGDKLTTVRVKCKIANESDDTTKLSTVNDK